MGTNSRLSIGQCTTLACLLEVTVPKPGNVHRSADFEDVTFLDFAVSATAIGPAMDAAGQSSVGATVLSAIRTTRRMVDTNTNLGAVLLLAPLASVARDRPIRAGVASVLEALTPSDAAAIYEAIHVACPGGMGQMDEMDVAELPPNDILEAMQAAAERDLVARQYTSGFATIFDEVVPQLMAGRERGWTLADTIIQAQLQLMSRHPDSLIARKCGLQVAQQSATRAASVLELGTPGSEAYLQGLGDFDFWLRSDNHRRNPGTTADLIAAGLFVALRDALITPPYR